MSTENLGKQIAIIMDNAVITAPIVNHIMDKQVSITGNFTLDEVTVLAALINAGSYPAKIKVLTVENYTID